MEKTTPSACCIDTQGFFIPEMARVVSTVPISGTERLLEISMPGNKPLGHQPGQFVQVSICGLGEAPISISSSPTRGSNFQLCVRNAGSVTQAIHQLKAGDSVGIRGPFGRGFPLEKIKGKDVLVVAGGLGLAPLRSLIQYIFDRRKDFGKFTLLLGAKRPEELLYMDEVQLWKKQPNSDIQMTVDRGNPQWKENVGVVTILFNRIQIDPEKTAAVVVGPPVMFKFVLLELFARKIPNDQIFVSLERRMKCGIGKCGHCQMGEFYVCKEGPAFSYAELDKYSESFGWKRK